MKTHVKALVVGGGAVGTSIAYHLAKGGLGRRDAAGARRADLRLDLARGGLLPLFQHVLRDDPYPRLFGQVLQDARGRDRAERRLSPWSATCAWRRRRRAWTNTCSMPPPPRPGRALRMADARQIKARWPLVRTEDLKGAIYHPTDGYINPADVTMAMAKGARQRGVTIERKWQVDGFDWTGDHWDVTLHQDGRKGRQPRALRRADRRSPPSMSSPPPATTRSAPRGCWGSRSPPSRSSTSSS
jgi:dimethylglycine dehydrogenase